MITEANLLRIFSQNLLKKKLHVVDCAVGWRVPNTSKFWHTAFTKKHCSNDRERTITNSSASHNLCFVTNAICTSLEKRCGLTALKEGISKSEYKTCALCGRWKNDCSGVPSERKEIEFSIEEKKYYKTERLEPATTPYGLSKLMQN